MSQAGNAIHERAWKIVEKMLRDQQGLKIQARVVDRATVIDCGIHTPGSQQAGRMFSEISMGGLGQVEHGWASVEDGWWPVVKTSSDHPALACLASQHSGRQIHKGSFSATACGPALSMIQDADRYRNRCKLEEGGRAILCCEGREFPTPDVVAWVADHCGVEREQVCILIAPTASIVGSIQMAARSVETGLYKMMGTGYDVERVSSAKGFAFLPPVGRDDAQALGRTNDAVIYGSVAYYEVDDAEENLRPILHRIPSNSSNDYGQLFGKLFERYGNFYNIDANLFGPSQVYLASSRSGTVIQSGQLRPDLLRLSFGYRL